MDEWNPYNGDMKGVEKLTYEPAFHWHGVVNFAIYIGCFAFMFWLLRMFVGML
jgi:hypothetical protein